MATRTAWIPTATTGEEVSQNDFRSIPGGWIGRGVYTAGNITGITADGYQGASETVTLVSGREYLVSAIMHVLCSSLGGNVSLDIHDGTTRKQIGRVVCSTINLAYTVTPWFTMDGDGASHQFRCHVDVITAGTYTYVNGAGFPNEIIIQDIGPST